MMSRYPVYKKGQKVQIIDSTYQPSSYTRELARRKRQAIIVERRQRSPGRVPSYDVAVRRRMYWGGTETEYYAFNVTDLVPWEKRNG